MRLKTKLILGLGFLFAEIVSFGILSIYYINGLSAGTQNVLSNNYESLAYANNMLRALESISAGRDSIRLFEDNLKKQEGNITEEGEGNATVQLRRGFEQLKNEPANPASFSVIRQALIRIQDVNEAAIRRKNTEVGHAGESAKLWISAIFTILTLISFSFIFNLPRVLSEPMRSLVEGIEEIAKKNYQKRIYLKQNDEFGELAGAFNTMAEKLDSYEHSSIAELQFEKSRLETVINQMRDAIIGLDAGRRIIFLNTIAQNLLGLKEKEVLGMYAPDIALKNDLMRTVLQPLGDNKDLNIYADNKESYFSRDIFSVTNNNEVIGQVVVLRNVTLSHELNEARTNFIATLSHQLKTPISIIKKNAQLLMEPGDKRTVENVGEIAGKISDEADRLQRITAELLNVTEVETGNIQLKKTAVSPKDLTSQATQAVQAQAQLAGVSMRVQIESELPAINVDAEKTTWVLINMLSNAVRYSPSPGTVEVDVKREDGQVVFSVQDHGKGIEAKYLPHIFERYFKMPGGLQGVGMGLALAISREFIEAQGGSIGVTSSPGEGSRFSISFKA